MTLAAAANVRVGACAAVPLRAKLSPRRPAGNGGSRMKRQVLAAVFVALLAGGYYVWGFFFKSASNTQTARPAPAQLVVGDVASAAAVPILVTAIGSVQSISTVMVKSRIDGEIANVNFEEGP